LQLYLHTEGNAGSAQSHLTNVSEVEYKSQILLSFQSYHFKNKYFSHTTNDQLLSLFTLRDKISTI